MNGVRHSMKSCAICMSTIPTPLSITTPCSHTFCNLCLTQWLLNHTSCPLCRFSLGTDKNQVQKQPSDIVLEIDKNLKGLNLGRSLVRVDSVINTIRYGDPPLYTWIVNEERDFFLTTFRDRDYRYTLFIEFYFDAIISRQLDRFSTPRVTPVYVWVDKYYIRKSPKPQNKNNWRIKNLNTVGRIKRKGKKKCRG